MNMKMLAVLAVGIGLAAADGRSAEVVIPPTGTPPETLTIDNLYPPMPGDVGEFGDRCVVLTNRRLSEFRFKSAQMTITGYTSRENVAYESKAWFMTVTNGVWEFQAQMRNSGDYQKGVKVRIFQEGPNIVAQTLWTRYQWTSVGNDLEKNYEGELPARTIYNLDVDNSTIYGLKSLTLEEYFTEANMTLLGETEINDGDTVVMGAGTALKIDETTPAETPLAASSVQMAEADALWVTNRGATVLAASFEGSRNVLRFGGGLAQCTCSTEEGVFLDGENTEGLLLARNAGIGDVVDIVSTDIATSSSFSTGYENAVPMEPPLTSENNKGGVFYIRRTANRITCQVQFTKYGGGEPWNRCAVAEIYENGNDLYVRLAGGYIGYYTLRGVFGVDFSAFTDQDFAESGGTLAKALACGLRNFKVILQPVARCKVVGSLVGLKDVEMSVSGPMKYEAASAGAFPASGSLAFGENAEVLVSATPSGCTGLQLSLGAGSRLVQPYLSRYTSPNLSSLFGGDSRVTADGAEIALVTHMCGDSGLDESAQYLNNVTLKNGATITGLGPRIDSGKWVVSGNEPSSSSCGGFLIGGKKFDANSFTVEVDDVTGDDRADFVDSGSYQDWTYNYESTYYSEMSFGLRVVKKGVGTWQMNAPSKYFGRTEVAKGTLLLVCDNAISNSASLVLNGGTLAVAAGTEQRFKTLWVTAADSCLDVGAGATVTFPAPSGTVAVWDADGTPVYQAGGTFEGGAVNIVLADDSSRVRVGTSRCLSAEQRRAFRIGGKRAFQDDEGYLVTNPGLAITIR